MQYLNANEELSEKPKLRDMLLNNWSVLFKNVKVKIKKGCGTILDQRTLISEPEQGVH